MASMENHEVLLTTEVSGQQWGVSAWDLHTGSSVRTFKGHAVAAGCLKLRSGHTLMGASASKPVLQLWSLCKKDESQQKIVCPGLMSALAVSPDGLFCIASISDKMYIWEMSAGNLLGLVSDFDEVKIIRFTDDGSQFVTGTSGGLMMMWDFAHVVSGSGHAARGPKPRRRVHAHSEAVTDIHVGCGGPCARVVTSSSDCSCKLWDMISGQLIRTFIYEYSVCSVIMDKQEYHLIAGLQSGEIWCSPLYSQVSQAETFVSKNVTKAGERLLQGHTGPITCLALSNDCQRLASGSEDGQVIVWDMALGNISLKILSSDVKGNLMALSADTAVGNVMIIPPISQNSSPAHTGPSVSFKQQMTRDETGRGTIFNVTVSDTSQWSIPDTGTDIAKMLRVSSTAVQENGNNQEPTDTSEKIRLLEKEVAHLKQINKDLHEQLSGKT